MVHPILKKDCNQNRPEKRQLFFGLPFPWILKNAMKVAMKDKQFQTGNVLLLSFSHFVHDIYTSFLSPLLPLIIEKLSISLGQAGLLSMMLQLPSLFNPFIGSLADRKGLARWLVILAPSLTAVPMSLIGTTSSYGMLLFLLFAAGTSVALFHVPSPVLIAQMSGARKGQGMSFYMTGGEAARTVGPLIAVGLVSMLGLENCYPVMIFALLTSMVLYFRLGSMEIKTKRSKKISFMSTVKETKPIIGPLSGILTFRAFMHSSMAVFLPVFVERQTGNLWFAGTALVAYEAMGVIGVLGAGTLSDRMGRRPMLMVSLVTAPLALFFFVMTGGILRFLMLLIAGLSILSTTPVMLALVQEKCSKSPAAANGLFMMISFVTRSITTVLVGVIGDFAGLENMFIICAVAGFGALPFIAKLKDHTKKT